MSIETMSLGPVERVPRSPPSAAASQQKHPRSSSVGGGRAWSETEEAYLIETRLHKMPYKHIAAHLQKTELACRLHYHQLSYGTKRRKRNDSISSIASSPAPKHAAIQRQSSTSPQRDLPTFSPPASPESHLKHAINDAVTNTSSHVPILPKPINERHQRAIRQSQALRLITQDIDRKPQSLSNRPHIDVDRLTRIYEAHSAKFWSAIKTEYGGDETISPALLEHAWRKVSAAQVGSSPYPPTPEASPKDVLAPASPPFGRPTSVAAVYAPNSAPSHYKISHSHTSSGSAYSGFSPINFHSVVKRSTSPETSCTSFKSACAISSLLTENKEVRSPERECQDKTDAMEDISMTS
ncbi:hypothetical protein MMC09_002544 [Bachmanniomyces sp. S44760]|nr:hypothetical protein [Bachmanniomyces sp. S44760]